MDRRRCGGTVWDLVPDADWDLYTLGKVAPYPIETTWVVSPIRAAVAVQSGSLEHMLCLCAYRGQEARIRRLLDHPYFAPADIHPGARADAWLYLRDVHRLEAVLLASPEARWYVCGLHPAHHDLDLVERAQAFCRVVEAEAAATAAVRECVGEMATA